VLASTLLIAKQFEVLHELVPAPAVTALLLNPSYTNVSDVRAEAQRAAVTLGRQLGKARLAGALKRLDTAEIDALLAAVTTEAERRGRRAKDKPTADARPQPRQASAEHGAGSLTTGKLNAVRAAFKAGVKPLAIARQFGISQSEVRKALATEDRDRKSSR